LQIKLYSTHCPRCEVLKKKLIEKSIVYEEINDTSIMLEKGFLSAPMLEVDNVVIDFLEATKWIKTMEQGDTNGH
jgi:glutaredoxin-related protein